jgi:transcriptional regulator with XRE-family HTH domain
MKKTIADSEKRARKIKSLLIARGIKQADVAHDLGLTRSAISHVIAGSGQSKRVQNHIAELLGEDPERLWEKAS